MTLIGSAGNAALLTFKFIAGVMGNSSAMIADAVHSLSDFVTDLLVLVKVAYELLKTSVGELTERSLPDETEQEIVEIIQSFADVQEPHNLRTRRIGNRIAIEAHVRMDGQLPLSIVHERATTIERKLKQRFGHKTHITLHMEPVK